MIVFLAVLINECCLLCCDGSNICHYHAAFPIPVPAAFRTALEESGTGNFKHLFASGYLQIQIHGSDEVVYVTAMRFFQTLPVERKLCNMAFLGENQIEIRKPLMEKKRRARINDCLEELKKMLLRNKKESLPESRPSKLEKADILEQTVELLKRLTETDAYNSDAKSCRSEADAYRVETEAYKSGFQDAQEKTKNLVDNYENLPPTDKRRLAFYLFPNSDVSHQRVGSTYKYERTKEGRKVMWRPW